MRLNRDTIGLFLFLSFLAYVAWTFYHLWK
jgi:hypothetical protein